MRTPFDRRCPILLAVLLVACCVTGCWDFAVRNSPPPDRLVHGPQLPDVPVPKDLVLDTNQSFGYQGVFRTAEVHYRGPIRPDETILFFRSEMPTEGWQFVEMTGEGQKTLRFRKGSEACTISVWREDGETSVIVEVHPTTTALAPVEPLKASHGDAAQGTPALTLPASHRRFHDPLVPR